MAVYVACKYKPESKNKIQQILEYVPNPVNLDDIHTTIIYSRTGTVDDIILPEVSTGYAVFREYDIWETDYGRVLVMKLGSFLLEKLHDNYMATGKLTYDYPKYIPHITLSYDVPKDFDINTLPVWYMLQYCDVYKEELKEY